jgi:TolA-binding protein
MNQTKILKRTIALACVLALSGLVGPAFGQDISKGPRDEAVSDKTKDEASKRTESLGKRLDQDRTKKSDEPSGPGASLDEFQDEQQTMTPEEIEALKRKIEAKNKSRLEKLDRIIENSPYSERKPEYMFQKAEILWGQLNMEYMRKRAQYNQCLTAAQQGTANDCEEPEPDYSEAQEIYKEILTQYPDYARLDEVIYRLGSGLIEAGKDGLATSYLQRLVNNYPNSIYLPDANLALAELFFKQENLMIARDKYQEVLKHKDNDNYDFALYKLGWVYYNLGEFRDSINTFKKVVERTNEKLGFQNQAINDLVVAYAEVDDGWKEMRKYFLEQRDQEFTYRKLGQMAGLYEGQGKDDQAIAIYEYFIDKRPNHENIPMWMESIIVAKKKINDFDDLEKTMNRYVAYLDPNGTWAKTNKENEGSLNNAALLSQASLAFLANTYHRRAQKLDTKEDYVAAIKYYEEFIERFPEQPASFDMNFFVADIYLLELENYVKAAEFYQKVVDLHKAGKTPKDAKQEDIDAIVKDSAYGVVNAYNELVKEHHEDSILVEMAKFQEEHGAEEFKKDTVDASTESKPNPKVEIPTYEKGFVEASDQYSEMYPDDDITPTIDYVSAEVYKTRGHYDKCIPRYQNIIENAPKHRYASYAGGSLLVANYVLKDWNEVEKWARYLMDNKIFHVTPKEDLKQAIALAINERAIELKDAEKFDEATDELLRLAKEFPKSELAPGALSNAAAIYSAAEENNKAVEVFERIVQEYPKSKEAPNALFVMGEIFKAQANFSKAAEYFARMGSTAKYVNEEGDEVEYKDHPKTANALFNAASLREAMEQWDEAIAAADKFVLLYKDSEDEELKGDVKTVMQRLPFLEMERENWKNALDRFQKYAKLDAVPKEEQVMINSEMGVLVEKIKDRGWEKKSNELFDKTVEIWKELDDTPKSQMRGYAAQARFRQAERIFDEFKAVKLEFPMSKLQKSMVKKGELEQEAEKVYREVIEMGSKKWLAAGAYRIGQMYRDFAQNLQNLPIPEGLTERQRMDYEFTLEDNIMPLKEKALGAFQYAVKKALEAQAYNEWSAKSAEQIASMEPEVYPIRKQERVDVEHGRINFFVPAAVTDMEAIAARVEARKPVAPKPQPAPGEQAPGESAPAEEGADAKGDSPKASK